MKLREVLELISRRSYVLAGLNFGGGQVTSPSQASAVEWPNPFHLYQKMKQSSWYRSNLLRRGPVRICSTNSQRAEFLKFGSLS